MGGGMGIKEGTCDEHRVMCGSVEQLYCTPEINITLCLNSLEFKNLLKKENEVYTYNGTVFNLKNEGNSGTFYSADEPGGHDAR